MTHVVVGSGNEGKVIACRRAFLLAFGEVEVQGIEVLSGVAAQPLDDECFVGARNRAEAARRAVGNLPIPADYFVGIEGGMVKLYGRWFGFSVACVIDREDMAGFGTSPLYEMPRPFIERVFQGIELRHVLADVTGDERFAERRGAIGLLTRGLLTREKAHEYGVLAALGPHLSAERYEQ